MLPTTLKKQEKAYNIARENKANHADNIRATVCRKGRNDKMKNETSIRANIRSTL